MASVQSGTNANETFFAGPGDQVIYAEGGKDTVVFTGLKSDYSYSSIYNSSTGALVTIEDSRFGSPDGSDTLFNVEVLKFADGSIDFTTPEFPNLPPVNSKPAFLNFTGSRFVSELSPVGTVIGELSAYDVDGDQISYSFLSTSGATLRIDGNKVILAQELDYETSSSVYFDVIASDGQGGSVNDRFLFLVKDEAEVLPTPPSIPNTAPTAIKLDATSVQENIKNGALIGTLTASDAENDALKFSLKDNAGGRLVIDDNQLKAAGLIDFETTPSLTFTVIATDTKGAATEQTITVSVRDATETIKGTAKADNISAGAGSDNLFGLAGADRLSGGQGNDRLDGGEGGDKLFGGAGADTFAFTSVKDSYGTGATRDSIFDFSLIERDRIDLSAIDANTKAAGNQAFSYIGTAGFHGKAGELRYEKLKSDTIVYADTNGDKKADFVLHFDDPLDLQKGFFVL